MQNIKYDPDQWLDVAKGKAVPCPREVHLRLCEPGRVSVKIGEVWRHVAYGTELKIGLSAPSEIQCSVAYSIFVGTDVEVEQIGQPLTNFDKRPGLSAVERMVRQTIMEARLDERVKREERAAHDRAMNAKRVAAGQQETNPVPAEPVEPVEGPVDEPVTEPADPSP